MKTQNALSCFKLFLCITNRLLGLVNMEVGGRQVGVLTQVGKKKTTRVYMQFWL